MGLWFSGISLALQPFSDLDLVIFSEPDNTVDYMEIQEIFDESTCSIPVVQYAFSCGTNRASPFGFH